MLPKALFLCNRVSILSIPAQNEDNFRTTVSASPCIQYAWIHSENLGDTVMPSSLAHLFCFHKAILKAFEVMPDKELVIIVARDSNQITNAALLLGGHMIIGQGISVEEVANRFSPIDHLFVPLKKNSAGGESDIAIEDCWRAMYHAKSLGWTNFDPLKDNSELCIIDIEEYQHYDDTPNGAMHLVDPSRLLLFRCPADLPPGRMWHDEEGRRLFGAEHYAGLFEDFDVRLVVRCGGAWDCGALEAAGVAVEDLRVEAGWAGMLAAVDRFVTLAREAPGCIAVQCGGGDDDSSDSDQDGNEGLGEETAARLVVAAHLIRNRGFGAAAAVAWSHIAHPAARQAGPELVLL